MYATVPEHQRMTQVQHAFCAHLREPQRHAAPHDVPPRRMALYRELFRANFAEQLACAFPVLRRISTTPYWEMLVEDFFAAHRCRSPLFHQLPREFLSYLQHERTAAADDAPFLLELAHYEWVELALAQAEDELPPPHAVNDVWQAVPHLSPLAWPLTYRYAVQRIGPTHLPPHPGPAVTHLLAYRNRRDAVCFMELNAVSVRLLQLIDAESGSSGAQLLRQIAAELQHPDPELVLAHGRDLLLELWRQDILLHRD